MNFNCYSDLASPLPSDNEPRLQFAGEATHDNVNLKK